MLNVLNQLELIAQVWRHVKLNLHQQQVIPYLQVQLYFQLLMHSVLEQVQLNR